MVTRIACLNRNHSRADAPVRFCASCGAVVNAKLPTKNCSPEAHAEHRRRGNKVCVDCGTRLDLAAS